MPKPQPHLPANSDPADAVDPAELAPKALDILWETVVGRPLSKRMKRSLAADLLRYELLVAHEGGLSQVAELFLASLLRRPTGSKAQVAKAARRFKPGTRLLRTWRGRTHTVTVADPGFLYDGKTYNSLSVIARKITGTAWSGPAFFKLHNRKRSAEVV